MKVIRRFIPVFAVLFLAVTMSACTTVTVAPPAPVTVPDVIQMSKAKVPSGEIIARMQASSTYYRLSAAELADLRAKGVSDPVINYMQQTYLTAVQNQQAMRDYSNWSNNNGWLLGSLSLSWSEGGRRGGPRRHHH